MAAPMNPTVGESKKLKSPVWDHFMLNKETQMASFNICTTQLMYKTGTTSNLRKNIDRKDTHT